ncbi:MAG TPA: hypothetical protein VM818_21745 [Vicinamibacterales bacterium]|nr:hypothetical protein [Vicinamibacterales bacterium]
MKYIIHDRDDARSANRPEGVFSKLADLDMLLMPPGGHERTDEDVTQLLRSAGLTMTRIVPTESIVSIVEAVSQ